MQQQPSPEDQHDTVVLGGLSPDQHDTAVLRRPAEATAPVEPTPAADGAGAAERGYAPIGWQAVSDWRDAMAQAAPTAWSQVPPFVPAAPPTVLVMRNNPAVVGATLGSASLFLSLIPLIGLVSLLLAPLRRLRRRGTATAPRRARCRASR